MTSLRLVALGLAAGLPLALSACAGVGADDGGATAAAPSTQGGQVSPSGQLHVMGFSLGDEVASSRVTAFRQSHPDVEVVLNKGSFDPQQFLTAVSSGNPPDLVYMERALLGTYAAQGAIVPLDHCVKSQHVDTGQYRDAALQQVTIDGSIYALPEFYTVEVNLVDTTSLRRAGVPLNDIQTTDWPALKKTARRLYRADGSDLQRIGYDTKMPDLFPLWVRANGAELINPDGSPNLNDPKAVEALEFNAEMVEAQGGWNDYQSFRGSFDFFGVDNELAAHQVGAFPMENWYLNVLLPSREKGLRLGSTMFTDRDGNPISLAGGNGWAIPKGAANPTAACAWAKTMTDKSTWMKAARARMKTARREHSFFTGLFTANKPADEAIKAKYLKSTGDKGFDQAIENYYHTLDIAKPMNTSPVASEIKNAWSAAVERTLSGKASARDSLERAQQEAMEAWDKAPKHGG